MNADTREDFFSKDTPEATPWSLYTGSNRGGPTTDCLCSRFQLRVSPFHPATWYLPSILQADAKKRRAAQATAWSRLASGHPN